jgi:hypothetical protein
LRNVRSMSFLYHANAGANKLAKARSEFASPCLAPCSVIVYFQDCSALLSLDCSL